MGNELSDEILQTSSGLAAEQSKRVKRKNRTKRTNKKKRPNTSVGMPSVDMTSKDLSNMKFMIGNKEISF